MSYLFFIIISFTPGLLWLLYFLQKDNLHPEPKILILETFLLGILISAPILVAEQSVILLTEPFELFYLSLIGAAFIEEYFKYSVLKIHILKSPEFDEPIDAMIYCITAGLGFATIENILWTLKIYLNNTKELLDPFFVLVIRGLGATILHALASGIVGFALAFSFFKAKNKAQSIYYIAAGLILSTIIHFLYNHVLMSENIVKEKFLLVSILLILTSIAISLGFKITKGIKA